MKDSFTNNLMELRGQILEACEEHDRDADDISIVAITKRFPASIINVAVAAGVTDIGESRVQEAADKITETGHVARYHMVGHLQSNKVKSAVQIFDVIQSVDSLKLAKEISRRAGEVERTIECLVQVNCSGETSKSGVEPSEALNLVRQVHALPHVSVTGLMTIGPLTDDKDAIRAAFRTCRDLFRQGEDIVGDEFDTLSMGMSDDFPLAIAEGSTMIRVGTVLFGQRPQ